MDALNAFAALHPWWFAAGGTIAGFLARTFLFTKANAAWLIRKWFDFQRAKLRRAGVPPEKIKELMEDEADFLLAAAKEAKEEADGEDTSAPSPAAPAPSAPKPA